MHKAPPHHFPTFHRALSPKLSYHLPVSMATLKRLAHKAAENTPQTLSKPEPRYGIIFRYSMTLNVNYQLPNHVTHIPFLCTD